MIETAEEATENVRCTQHEASTIALSEEVAKVGLEPTNLAVLDFESSASAIPPLGLPFHDTPRLLGRQVESTVAEPGFGRYRTSTAGSFAAGQDERPAELYEKECE